VATNIISEGKTTWEDLPKGFTAKPIDWPEPQPVLMFQIKAQGYERDVVLPIRITPPTDLKDGTSITLQGKALWMACARECNPGFKELSITLPVKLTSAAAYDPKWHSKFDAERVTRPRTSDAWQAKITSKDKHHTLTLTPKTNARPLTRDEASKLVFFTEDGIIDSDKPQKIELRENGEVVIELIEAEYIVGGRPKALTGVILRKSGWERDGEWRCMRISASLK
jgi:thiol:disulfide interchange protein DsbD